MAKKQEGTGDNIVGLRIKEAIGLDSQNKAANRVGCDQSQISKYINGDCQPSVPVLIALSSEYGVSVDWLLGLSDLKNINNIDDNSVTYEQIVKLIDVLYDHNSIEDHQVGNGDHAIHDFGTIEVKDTWLLYLLEQRSTVKKSGKDFFKTWEQHFLSKFNVELLNLYGSPYEKKIETEYDWFDTYGYEVHSQEELHNDRLPF